MNSISPFSVVHVPGFCHSTRHSTAFRPVLLAAASLVCTILCALYFHQFSFWRCTVVNTQSAALMTERGDAKRQDPNAPGLIRFRAQIAPLLKPGWGTLNKIAVVRHWARIQQPDDRRVWNFPPWADSGDVDPEILLQQQRASKPGACRRFGYVLAGALLSIGIPARLVSLQPSFRDGFGHIMVEAWVDELNKWVLVDAMTDTRFQTNGNYASLLELRRALVSGALNSIRFERNGSNLEPPPRLPYLAQISKHAFVFKNECLFTDSPLTKASLWRFQLLHYVDRYAEPYPELSKDFALFGALVFGGCTVLFVIAAVARIASVPRQTVAAHPVGSRVSRGKSMPLDLALLNPIRRRDARRQIWRRIEEKQRLR